MRLNSEANFCHKCGAPVVDEAESALDSRPKEGSEWRTLLGGTSDPHARGDKNDPRPAVEQQLVENAVDSSSSNSTLNHSTQHNSPQHKLNSKGFETEFKEGPFIMPPQSGAAIIPPHSRVLVAGQAVDFSFSPALLGDGIEVVNLMLSDEDLLNADTCLADVSWHTFLVILVVFDCSVHNLLVVGTQGKVHALMKLMEAHGECQNNTRVIHERVNTHAHSHTVFFEPNQFRRKAVPNHAGGCR
jgi:hypothetical protein